MWKYCPKCKKELIELPTKHPSWIQDYKCDGPECNFIINVTSGDNGHGGSIDIRLCDKEVGDEDR